MVLHMIFFNLHIFISVVTCQGVVIIRQGDLQVEKIDQDGTKKMENDRKMSDDTPIKLYLNV